MTSSRRHGAAAAYRGDASRSSTIRSTIDASRCTRRRRGRGCGAGSSGSRSTPATVPAHAAYRARERREPARALRGEGAVGRPPRVDQELLEHRRLPVREADEQEPVEAAALEEAAPRSRIGAELRRSRDPQRQLGGPTSPRPAPRAAGSGRSSRSSSPGGRLRERDRRRAAAPPPRARAPTPLPAARRRARRAVRGARPAARAGTRASRRRLADLGRDRLGHLRRPHRPPTRASAGSRSRRNAGSARA